MRNWHHLKKAHWTVSEGFCTLLGYDPMCSPIKFGDDLEIREIADGTDFRLVGRFEDMRDLWDSDPAHHGKQHFPAEYFLQWAERVGYLPEDEWVTAARQDGVLVGSPVRIAPANQWKANAEAYAAEAARLAGLLPQPGASPAPPPGSTTEPKPLQRQRHQETEVLRVLCDLGHDPKSLPRNSPGRPGPKAAAWEHLRWQTGQRGVFDKAWERLRASGEIQDA